MTTRKRMTKKERRDKFLAKMIYNSSAMVFYAIGGGIVGILSALIPHLIAPELDFYTYLIWVMIVAFIGICILAVVACLVKMGVYKLLCMITRSK